MSDRPEGGCCGAGEACSSAACTGTPVAVAPPAVGGPVFPEPRNDAAVFGAPRAPMYGGRDEDGL